MDNLLFRKAILSDVEAIVMLVQNRIDWMNESGLHQWNETDYFGRYPFKYWTTNIDRFIVGELNGRVVVAIALYTEDIRWTRDGHLDHPTTEGKAYYLHHLVTDPTCAGAGVAMMKYAEQYAIENGVSVLRLDSAIGNSNLEKYYTALGYVQCGICHDRLYNGVLREKSLV